MNFKSVAPRIAQICSANIGLKMGSLLLAIILWVTITGQGTSDRIIRDITYQIKNIPEKMALTDKGAGVIQIRIKGPKSLIPTLKSEDFTVSLTLPNDIEAGKIPLTITHSNVITPYSNQLSILQILPSTVTVNLDQVIRKSVNIKPFLRGAPDPNYELGQWRVSPPTAIIEGPASVLEEIEEVYTEAIDIAGQTLSFDDRVIINPQNNLIQVIGPYRVKARVEIRERITERSFPEFEITAFPDPVDSLLNISPSVVTLTLTGPASILNQLLPSDIQIIADWSDLSPGDHEIRPVPVTNEERITSVNVDPDIIMVSVPEATPTPSPSPSPTTSQEVILSYAISPTS
ncbi:hypothetical protein K8T06_06740 [bacterium]|nr:hypothetical protein [bacterium]